MCVHVEREDRERTERAIKCTNIFAHGSHAHVHTNNSQHLLSPYKSLSAHACLHTHQLHKTCLESSHHNGSIILSLSGTSTSIVNTIIHSANETYMYLPCQMSFSVPNALVVRPRSPHELEIESLNTSLYSVSVYVCVCTMVHIVAS